MALLLCLLLRRSRSEWIVRATKAGRGAGLGGILELRCTLLVVKWVIAGLCGLKSPHTACARRIDEGTWGRVLRRDTQVADVAECVLTFAGGKKGIEASLIRVFGLRRTLLLLWSRRCCRDGLLWGGEV